MAPRVLVTVSRIGSARHLASRPLYAAALSRGGVEPFEVQAGDTIPASFDGLCLSGGGDIDPARYGAARDERTVDIDPLRDEIELDLIERALAGDRPILGICRGFQMLNVRFGGSLEQHREGHSAQFGALVPHVVLAAEGSLLASIIGPAPCAINSSHHQAVTTARLAKGLTPTTWVEDLVEAFEAPDHAWVVGVQWHPERTSEVAEAATRIFAAFGHACAA